MKKIQVMLVEDSAVVRGLLEHIIGSDPRLEVCASAASAEHALQLLELSLPDVIAMDIRLPGIDGLECTRRIMSNKPVPIVVVAAPLESGTWNAIPMEVLRAGALTLVEKPAGTTHADYQELAARLCTQLVIMSQIILVRQHGRREAAAAQNRASGSWRGKPGAYTMLGIAASTGGPSALIQLLGELGADFPLPILLVQHMTANFVDGFAAWLNSVCPFAVTVARHGSIPEAGALYLAPAERHLRLDAGRLRVDSGDQVSFQRPSGTVLFRSMARDLGSHALAVLLTGMGDDGASGLLDIRKSGGFTIAEDESTAVVYGMPAAAVRLGAVCESLPLPAIAGRVLELVSFSHSAAAFPARQLPDGKAPKNMGEPVERLMTWKD
jgi:two-component system, chemotaxis family, protein-glutamate methylesterase/glutaminase